MQLTMRYVEETAEGEEQDALEAGLLQDVDELLEGDDEASPGEGADNDGSSLAASAAGRPLASAYDASPRVPEGPLLDVTDDDDSRPPPSTSRTNQLPPPAEEDGDDDDGGGGWGDAFSDYSAPREQARASIELDSRTGTAGFGPAGIERGVGHSRGDSAAWGLEEDEAALLDDVQASPPVGVDLGRDRKERID